MHAAIDCLSALSLILGQDPLNSVANASAALDSGLLSYGGGLSFGASASDVVDEAALLGKAEYEGGLGRKSAGSSYKKNWSQSSKRLSCSRGEGAAI